MILTCSLKMCLNGFSITRHCLKTKRGSGPWTCEKTDPFKNWTSSPKMLSFVSCNMKDNVEVIHFYIKSRGVQGLVFAQITLERYHKFLF